MTVILDSTVIAALVAWSGFAFWLGRLSAARRSVDLSGPPAGVVLPRAAPSVVRAPAELTPEVLAAIREELARGNKINAIKLLRDATKCGLKEAKDAVEAMQG